MEAFMITRIMTRISDFCTSHLGRAILSSALVLLSLALVLLMALGSDRPTVTIDDLSLSIRVENFSAGKTDTHYVLRDFQNTEGSTHALYDPVTVVCDGESRSHLIGNETVGELLARTGYVLGEKDYVIPAADTALSLGDVVRIIRVSTKTVTVQEAVSYTTVFVDDPSAPQGSSSVLTPGIDGQQECTYSITYENGKEVSRTLLSSKTLSKPAKAVISRGTGEGGYITLPDGTVRRYTKIMRLEATAYNSANTPNITAIGTIPKWGTVAIDRRVIPLMSEVFVTSLDGEWSYGVGLCEDTGVIGQRIDLYMNSLKECFTFGRRDVYVYILADED